jgi:hypothetical protein
MKDLPIETLGHIEQKEHAGDRDCDQKSLGHPSGKPAQLT